MSATCSVWLCKEPAVDKSPETCQDVCNAHLQSDLCDLSAKQSLVLNRVEHFKKYAQPLRRLQQRATSDLQILEENFDELRNTLDRCQRELFECISKKNEQLLASLSIISEIEKFERELGAANQQNNIREAFILNKRMGRALETLNLNSELVHMLEADQQVKMVTFPDVNSRITELKSCTEQHLLMCRNLIEALDVNKEEQSRIQMMKTVQEVAGLCAPTCMALCNKTDSIVVDSSGRIHAAQNAPEGAKLPATGVFVAAETITTITTPGVENEDGTSTEATTEQVKSSEISLVSNGQVLGKLACCWEANQPIRDLHCDSEHQLLYIAQQDAAIVSQISGVLQSKIAVSDLVQDAAAQLLCITGNADKLFGVVRLPDGKHFMFAVSKRSQEIQIRLQLPDSCTLQPESRTRISVSNGMLKLQNNQNVFIVCTITGLPIQSGSYQSPEIVGNNDGVGADDDEIAVHLMFSEWQPEPSISTLLKPKQVIVPDEILRTNQSATQVTYMMLKAGRLIDTKLEVSKR